MGKSSSGGIGGGGGGGRGDSRNSGLKPIYYNGELKGWSDTKNKIDYPLNYVNPNSGTGGIGGGGGGGRSGGGSSGGSSSQTQAQALAQAQAKALAETQALAQAQAKTFAEKKAQDEAKAREQAKQDLINKAKLVSVSQSGKVTVGNSSYVGNAFINDVGMTANQYNDYLRGQAVKSGDIDIKDYNRVSFKGYLSEAQAKEGNWIKADNQGEVTSVLNIKDLENITPSINNQRMTISTKDNIIGTTTPIMTSPYLEKRTIGYDKNLNVPISKIYYVNPKGEDLGGGATRQTERPATDEEIKNFQSSAKVGAISTDKLPIYKPTLDIIKDDYEKLNNDLKESITNPILKDGRGEAVATVLTYSSPLAFNKDTREFMQGFNEGIIKDIRDNPLKQVALYGAGAGLGVAFKGASTGLSAIPKVGGKLATGFKLGATGYGVYEGAKMIGATAGVMAMQEDLSKSGSVLGVAVKDALLLGIGFTKGEKGFDILKGKMRTRGLPEIEIKQGEYPRLPIDKQLEAFQKNIIKDISKKPVSFHTTPDVFYQDGVITPKAGTSELPGLYASTQISTPFSKIAGSGGKLDSLKAFKQAIKDIFAPERNPGVASLEPKGFRNVKYRYSNTPQFEGQKSIRGKYALFENPPRQGFMDIPGMKTEIEAIARTDAGIYGATGKRFKVKIKGVDVPVDSFKYVENQIAKNIDDIYNNLGKKIDENFNKIFKPQDYPSYQEPTLKTSLPSLSALSKSIQVEPSSTSSSVLSDSLASSTSSSVLSDSLASSIARSSSVSPVSSKSSTSRASSSNATSYDIYSDLYGTSSQTSGKSSKVSSSLSSSRTGGGSSSGLSILSPSVIKEIMQPPKLYNNQRQPAQQKKSLGSGYWVYVKQIRGTQFNKVNNYPLTKSRAEDIGTYLVDTSVARTFQVKKANQQAQEDYQFMYVPVDYYKLRKGKLRNYRVKNKNPYDLDMERYIEKSKFVGDTPQEIRQLQAFQRQVARMTK